ncbi:hypothetical protein ACWDSJ_16380 [Nocardia sp. NPDC003482]
MRARQGLITMLVKVRNDDPSRLSATERTVVNWLKSWTGAHALPGIAVIKAGGTDAIVWTPKICVVMTVKGFTERVNGTLAVSAHEPWTIDGRVAPLEGAQSGTEAMGEIRERTAEIQQLLRAAPGREGVGVIGVVLVIPQLGTRISLDKGELPEGIDVVVGDGPSSLRSYVARITEGAPDSWNAAQVGQALGALGFAAAATYSDLTAEGFPAPRADRTPSRPADRAEGASVPPGAPIPQPGAGFSGQGQQGVPIPQPGGAYSPSGAAFSGQQGAPMSGQGAPIPGQGAPMGGQGAPIPGQSASVGGQGAPIPGQGAPMGGQGAPIPGQASPIGGQGAPIPGQNVPMGGQSAPIPGQGAPIPHRGAPIPAPGTPLAAQATSTNPQGAPIPPGSPGATPRTATREFPSGPPSSTPGPQFAPTPQPYSVPFDPRPPKEPRPRGRGITPLIILVLLVLILALAAFCTGGNTKHTTPPPSSPTSGHPAPTTFTPAPERTIPTQTPGPACYPLQPCPS